MNIFYVSLIIFILVHILLMLSYYIYLNYLENKEGI